MKEFLTSMPLGAYVFIGFVLLFALAIGGKLTWTKTSKTIEWGGVSPLIKAWRGTGRSRDEPSETSDRFQDPAE